MGSSAKKKQDKRKDFKKPKLKVGKARPKATNFTDTSFKSKAIVLTHQSLSTSAPSTSSQFSHHLSLLSSRAPTQRRDSLAYLTTAITSRPVDTPLHQPASVLLHKLCPLILDESNGVRTQLLRVFNELPPQELEPHIGQLLLYTRAGLTHLAADIRSSATDTLLWLLEISPNEVICCAGGWVKTLKCLLTVLHWHLPATPIATKGVGQGQGFWTSSKTSTLANTGTEGRLPVKTLNALAAFLRAGLLPISEQENTSPSKWPFPLRHVQSHMIPKRSNAFAHLNLFGPPRDEEAEMYTEREERQRIFYSKFRTTVESGLQAARREGGDVGRAAAGVGKALVEGMEGFEPDV